MMFQPTERMPRRGRAVFLWLSFTVVGVSCDVNAPVYFPQLMPMETGEGGGSVIQTMTLEFRGPTEAERQHLRDLRAQQMTRPRFDIPWIRRRHVALSLQYTITNLSNQPGRAQVLVDGANEFTLYNPGATRSALAMMPGQDVDEIFLPSLIETTPIVVPPRGQVTGNIREDDFAEAALDLDAMGRFMGNYAALLIHRSEQSSLGLEMVPAEVEVPQFYQVIVTLVASTRMRLEFVVRVRDAENVLAEAGDRRFNPQPTTFVPDVAGAMPMNARQGMMP